MIRLILGIGLLCIIVLLTGCEAWFGDYYLEIEIEGKGEVHPANRRVNEGIVTFDIQGKQAWAFDGWGGTHASDIVEEDGVYSIYMDQDKELIARFKPTSLEAFSYTNVQSFIYRLDGAVVHETVFRARLKDVYGEEVVDAQVLVEGPEGISETVEYHGPHDEYRKYVSGIVSGDYQFQASRAADSITSEALEFPGKTLSIPNIHKPFSGPIDFNEPFYLFWSRVSGAKAYKIHLRDMYGPVETKTIAAQDKLQIQIKPGWLDPERTYSFYVMAMDEEEEEKAQALSINRAILAHGEEFVIGSYQREVPLPR